MKNSIVKSIIDDLLNTNLTFQEIGKKYNVAATAVGRINRGDTYKGNYNYPLRQTNKKNIVDELSNHYPMKFVRKILKYGYNINYVKGVNDNITNYNLVAQDYDFIAPLSLNKKSYELIDLINKCRCINENFLKINDNINLIYLSLETEKYIKFLSFFNVEISKIKNLINNNKAQVNLYRLQLIYCDFCARFYNNIKKEEIEKYIIENNLDKRLIKIVDNNNFIGLEKFTQMFKNDNIYYPPIETTKYDVLSKNIDRTYYHIFKNGVGENGIDKIIITNENLIEWDFTDKEIELLHLTCEELFEGE